jgi:hypothetical protein
MFNIIIKNKPIIVDCFISNPAIHEFFPIELATNFYPAWWKSLESSMKNTNDMGMVVPAPTIKRCDGIIELYKKGFILPLWSDLIVETTNAGEFRYQYSSFENLPIVNHTHAAMGGAFNKFVHMKIQSPWILEEKSGVKFLWQQPSWNSFETLNDLHILPGIVNYKDQGGTHINALISKKNNRLELMANQPLVHIIPVSDRPVIVKNHIVTHDEWHTKSLRYSFLSSFLGKYKKNVKKSSS